MTRAQAARQVKAGIYEVGAIDRDRRLFDELIPLPDGTSYNAYLVQGSERTALLDTVDPPKIDLLFEHLEQLGVKDIDYVISHHAEQDHSGGIPALLERYPGAKVVTNAKGRAMLMDLLDLEEGVFVTVADGEKLGLGDKTLQFMELPWVHWPETMASYLTEDRILFSCDFFGAHLASSTLFAGEGRAVYEAAQRYYAEIMMPFRGQITKNLEKIKDLPIEIIAPSHGPIYDNPRFILEAYRDWVSDKVKNEVVLAYVSMHGSTKKMAEYLAEALIKRRITVKQFNLAELDLGKLAMGIVDAATLVMGVPTVLTGAHPLAAYAALVVNALRPKTKFVALIGSYGWAGKMVEELTGLFTRLKVELLEPVLARGYPREADFAALDRLADAVLAKHQEIGIAR